MIKKILLMLFCMNSIVLSDDSLDLIIKPFINNAFMLNELEGYSYDIVADFEVKEKSFERLEKEIIKEFTTTTSHIFSGQKHFGTTKTSPDGFKKYEEYAWDGKKNQTFIEHAVGEEEYSVSRIYSPLIQTFVAMESLLFPYRILYPDTSQGYDTYPTPYSILQISEKDLSDRLSRIDLNKSDGEKVIISSLLRDRESYQLVFTNNDYRSPEKIKLTVDGGEAREIVQMYTVTEWLQNPDLKEARFPKEIIMETYNNNKELMYRKAIHVRNFKILNEVPDNQFIIDGTRARYFIDRDKEIRIDTKNAVGEKL